MKRISHLFVLMYLLLSCSRDWSNPISPGGNNNNPIPTNGLIAYYPFNGNANDESGNGHNGLVYGATLTSDRKGSFNGAYSFDGIDDYIDIGNSIKPSFPVTVSIWIYIKTLHNACILRNDKWDDGGFRYGLALSVGENGAIASYVFSGYAAPSTRSGKTSSNLVIEINKWNHFLSVFEDSNNMQIYWNSTEIYGVYSGTGTQMTYSNNSGALGKTSISGGAFNGYVDDVRVYNRILSGDEIQQLFLENNK